MSISVLLADDSKFIRKALKKDLPALFPGKELMFTEAANGVQALDLISHKGFDLVFLDLTMPEKTGYQVLEELKEKGVQATIIVLTADIQPGAEKIVMDLGASGYIKKERPLNLAPLDQILRDGGIL
ncbi:MAG: response regulator [Desulfobacter sp.]|nr:MAG: response regulator [Desulfobacter sp.]